MNAIGTFSVVQAILVWLIGMTSFAVGEQPRNMLLMLPGGPIHLRVELSDGGISLQSKRDAYRRHLVETLDVNADGKLSSEETAKHPLFVTGRRFQGNKFLESRRSQKTLGDRELEIAIERTAGKVLTYRQNSASTEQDLSVFRVLDADESGLIERLEMRTAAARIAARDFDFDQCISFNEFLEQSATDPNLQFIANDTEPPGSVHSELLRDADEPLMAQRLVRRYDQDRDAHLSATELGWDESRLSGLDTDADQKLSLQELSSIPAAEPDLTLKIDLQDDAELALKLIGGQVLNQVERARGDLIKLDQTGLSLSIGYQIRDVVAEAERNATLAFNAIDIDANGYLDRQEIIGHQRFERYLFDAMDADGDDRLFASELLSYVIAYSEPAMTTCQVTLYDIGNGFFQRLDMNSDGRISVRELRQCEDTLLQTTGSEESINPSQMSKSYRIEFQRGGVGLFGRVDRPEAEIPQAFMQTPSGPIWFRRMDRNSDGDLVWDEFLGPRDVFHELDRDQDNLIDADEASSYSER